MHCWELRISGVTEISSELFDERTSGSWELTGAFGELLQQAELTGLAGCTL